MTQPEPTPAPLSVEEIAAIAKQVEHPGYAIGNVQVRRLLSERSANEARIATLTALCNRMEAECFDYATKAKDSEARIAKAHNCLTNEGLSWQDRAVLARQALDAPVAHSPAPNAKGEETEKDWTARAERDAPKIDAAEVAFFDELKARPSPGAAPAEMVRAAKEAWDSFWTAAWATSNGQSRDPSRAHEAHAAALNAALALRPAPASPDLATASPAPASTPASPDLLEVAVKALEPFAKAADNLAGLNDGYRDGRQSFLAVDLRRARSAHAALTKAMTETKS